MKYQGNTQEHHVYLYPVPDIRDPVPGKTWVLHQPSLSILGSYVGFIQDL